MSVRKKTVLMACYVGIVNYPITLSEIERLRQLTHFILNAVLQMAWLKIVYRVRETDTGGEYFQRLYLSPKLLKNILFKARQTKIIGSSHFELKYISTADGEKHNIQGLVELPININNVIQV